MRRILKTLAAKKFPTIPQLIDISNQEEDAESVLDSNEGNVLEDDNETASIKKDAEIEKLKRVVINLTGVSEKYKKQIADMTEKSIFTGSDLDFSVSVSFYFSLTPVRLITTYFSFSISASFLIEAVSLSSSKTSSSFESNTDSASSS